MRRSILPLLLVPTVSLPAVFAMSASPRSPVLAEPVAHAAASAGDGTVAPQRPVAIIPQPDAPDPIGRDGVGSEEGDEVAEVQAALDGLVLVRHDDPARSVIEDADGSWVATFTDDARTVAVVGPSRRFEEKGASHGVTTNAWVRVLDEPFDGVIDRAWLDAARRDESPDVLEVASQYFRGAPDVVDGDGVLISADASYGPLQPDGSRPVGSDWHDFRGVTATYGDIVDEPDPEEYRSLDCSGYVRIVFGFRFGIPMILRPDGGESLPRRSFEQAAEAPGVVPIANRGKRVKGLGPTDPGHPDTLLQAGDLVFFDAPSDSDGRIDHVGIYLGVDDAGHHRFIHSRRSHNGPTMGGDANGPSILDGDGFFARGLRATRRL